jgi:hypothetical protein
MSNYYLSSTQSSYRGSLEQPHLPIYLNRAIMSIYVSTVDADDSQSLPRLISVGRALLGLTACAITLPQCAKCPFPGIKLETWPNKGI